MNKHTKKILQALPDNLSESGVAEVAQLLDGIVEERVTEEVTKIEAKVRGYLRTKIDEMKSVALTELEAENDTVRSHQMYEAIRAVVAADIANSDEDGLVSHLQTEVEELQDHLDVVNGKLSQELNNTSLLRSKVSVKENKIGELSELLEEEINKTDTPFKSSESAVVITNENQNLIPEGAANNGFLTEDVIRLSRPLQD